MFFTKTKEKTLWVLSIVPNRPVRDKWEYRRKMERHFPIKPGQQNRNGSCHYFFPFPNSLIRAKNRFVKNGTAIFGRNIPTEISGPPPEVIPNIPVGRNRNGPFHLISGIFGIMESTLCFRVPQSSSLPPSREELWSRLASRPFRLYILFSRCRSCDNTQEVWSFALSI